MNQITRPGMYARKIGITQPITGPSAASSSLRHGSDTQMLNPTQANVRSDRDHEPHGRSEPRGRSRTPRQPAVCSTGRLHGHNVRRGRGDLFLNQGVPRLVAGR